MALKYENSSKLQYSSNVWAHKRLNGLNTQIDPNRKQKKKMDYKRKILKCTLVTSFWPNKFKYSNKKKDQFYSNEAILFYVVLILKKKFFRINEQMRIIEGKRRFVAD